MLKRFTLLATLLLACAASNAQDNDKVNLGFEFRGDFYKGYVNEEPYAPLSGFKGKVINLKVSGQLTDNISYNFRHRLNKPQSAANMFDATDFCYIAYDTEKWRFSAGKQTYMLGGFEYDLAAIDFYYMSEFSSQFPCYKGALTATYKTGKDELSFQITSSPFRQAGQESYSYNFFWKGNHDWFSSTYSINLLESNPGEYIKYIALGNRVSFGRFTGFIDLMSRSPWDSTDLGLDYSLICKLSYSPADTYNIFVKCSQDVNDWAAGTTFDKTVLPGTSITKIGGGVEIWPVKKLGKNVRIHATAHYGTGTNTNINAGIIPGEFIFNLGLTWRFRVI